LKRLRDTLRYDGMASFSLRLLAKGLRPFAHVGIVRLYRKDLRRPVARRPAQSPIQVVEATEADTDRLVALVESYVSPQGELGREQRLRLRQGLVKRFQRGWRCFVAKAGPEIIHYNWMAFDWADSLEPELGFFIIPGEDEVFCLDAYTAEPWRGKGVHTAVLSEMLTFLQERGYRTAYTNVALDKKSAWKTHEKLGWDLSGVMLYLRLRGTHRTWARALAGTLAPFVEKGQPPVQFPESSGNRG
jgi:GNAT superfamily N-acetyltransferase